MDSLGGVVFGGNGIVYANVGDKQASNITVNYFINMMKIFGFYIMVKSFCNT